MRGNTAVSCWPEKKGHGGIGRHAGLRWGLEGSYSTVNNSSSDELDGGECSSAQKQGYSVEFDALAENSEEMGTFGLFSQYYMQIMSRC